MAEAPQSAFAALIKYYMYQIRYRLEGKPITANKLANEVGISRQTVTNWMNGRQPQRDELLKLASKTGIPLHVLLLVAGYAPADFKPEVSLPPEMALDITRQAEQFLLEEAGVVTTPVSPRPMTHEEWYEWAKQTLSPEELQDMVARQGVLSQRVDHAQVRPETPEPVESKSRPSERPKTLAGAR